MADETKRVIDQTTDTSLAAGDFIIVDSQSEGTRKFDLGTELTGIKQDLEDLQEEIEGGGQGLTAEFKQALHNIFEKVAFIDGNGQDYLDALDDAMSPVTAISLNTNTLSFSALNTTQQLTATTTPSGGAVSWSSSNTSVATVSSSGVVTSVGYGTATITASSGSVSASCSVVVAQATLVSIACVYTQSGTVYESTSLDSLKSDLVVTATWDNSTTSTVASTDYELSGTLTEGTSTITVTYGGKTTTFNVTVTSANNYVAIGNPTISNGILTVENGKYVRSNYALSPTSGQSWKIRQKLKYNNLPSGFVNIIGGSGDDAFYKSFIIQENNDKQYIFYVSTDGSNWTVSNKYTGNNLNLNTTEWFYVEFGYNGTQYYLTIKKDGWDGTLINTSAHAEATSNVVMINGKYVGFGVTSSVSGFDGQIDLNDCSIYVDDVLVWQAITA